MPARSSTFEFAERVARDDDFRDRVALEPQAALADYGLAASAGVIPERVELPAREEVLGVVGVRREEPEPEPEPPLPEPEPDIIGPPQNLGLMLAAR
jgi:hypothetical protein